MRYGHELTPAEQQQPPTMVVPAEQIQALATHDTARVSDVDHSILAGSYEAANRRANALQEQRGIQNDIARTALGQVFEGAANIGGNRIAQGRLRGTDVSGAPIFEKVEAQAERQRAWEARQAAMPAATEEQGFGPRAEVYQQPVKPPAVPTRTRETSAPASEAHDPYYYDMVEAHREQRREARVATQRSDPSSAASRLEQQPRQPHDEEDQVFDDPLGSSKRRYQ